MGKRVVVLLVLGVLLDSTSLVRGGPFTWDNPSKSYSGYSLLRTEPIVREDYAQSLLVLDGMHGIHFWKYPLVNRSSDILASPHQLQRIQSLLSTMGLGHNVIIQDVEELLRTENEENEDGSNNEGRASLPSSSSKFFQRYQRYDAIMSFAKNLAASDSRVTFEKIGKSTEKRDIALIKISSGDGEKPAIFIDGGMHAREWISPATATYIMNKLTMDESKGLVEQFDWYIVPIINVDGYEYTHTTDRMWRKTRSRKSGARCIGVDPNRNWGFHWAEQGSSSDPCSDIYHGPKAFSEPETLALSKAIKARPNIELYITFHSYSQLWLIPYGYGNNKRPSDYSELVRLGGVGKKALESTYQTKYKMGTAPDLLYPAAGGSDDWAKGAAGIKYVYCLELRDTGRYGFLLPASQITATGEETWNGVKAMAKDLEGQQRKKHKVTTPTTTRRSTGVKGFVNADKEMNSPNGGNYEELQDYYTK